MKKNVYDPQDTPSAKLAEVFITVGTKRHSVLNAKDFEANASIENADVPILGRLIKGKKAIGMEIAFKMTAYKCTEMFDDIVEEFKNTGVMPNFDIQVTSEDPASKMGRSTKIYTDCVLDGDILLSFFDSDGEFIEQEINGFAMDYDPVEKYTPPSYM